MKNKVNIIIFILSIFVTLGLCLNLSYQETYEGIISITNIYVSCGLFIGIWYLIKQSYLIYQKNKENNIFLIIFSVILSVIQILCYYYNKYDSIDYLFANLYQQTKTILYIFSLSIFVFSILNLIKSKLKELKYTDKANKLFVSMFDKKTQRYITGIFVIVYAILAFLYYPGNTTYDFYDEIHQYNHIETETVDSIILINEDQYINGHHSAFHTVLTSVIISIGMNLVDQNFGLFLNVLLQIILSITTYCYLFKIYKKLKIPYIFRIISLLMLCLLPVFTLNTLTVVKDSMFATSILLFTLILIDYLYLQNRGIKTILKLVLSALLVTLLAKKGFYIILATSIILLVTNFKNLKKYSFILLIPVFIYMGYDYVIENYFDVTPGSVKKMIALPIKQIGRVVTLYGDELTEEEKETINNIIEYDAIAENYSSKSADKLKYKYFNKYYTSDQLKDFLILYVKLFLRYPKVYVDDFIAGTSNYYYISKTSTAAYFDIYQNYPPIAYENFTKTTFRININNYIVKFYSIAKDIPIINILFSKGFYFWINVFSICYVILKTKFKNLAIITPSIVCIIFIFLAPVDGNSRYVWPIVNLSLIMIPLCYKIFKSQKNRINA